MERSRDNRCPRRISIPLIPASLLVTPHLWRNVCPLATLNKATNFLGGRRLLTPRIAGVTGPAGIVLLALMVPARRFLFNTDAAVLAVAIRVPADPSEDLMRFL